MDVLAKPNDPSGLFKLNGLDYTWPASRAAGVVKDNGSGILSIDPLVLADIPAPAACRVNVSALQSIASGVATAVAWDLEDFDTDTMHDNVTNNTRITVKTAGRYIFAGSILWTAQATGQRSGYMQRSNGARLAQIDIPGSTSSGGTCPIITLPIQMAVNDYVEFFAFQNSGVSLSIGNGSNYGDVFWAVRIGS